MSKKLWAFVILMLIVTGTAVACAVSEPAKITVGNGLVWIGTNIVGVFNAAGHFLLTSPIGCYLGWVGLGVGLIFGAFIIHRITLPKILQRNKTETSGMPPPITSPKTIIVKEEPLPTRTAPPPPVPIEEEVVTA